jgi:hypothetical protein
LWLNLGEVNMQGSEDSSIFNTRHCEGYANVGMSMSNPEPRQLLNCFSSNP